MRIHFVHHAADLAFVAALTAPLGTHHMEPWPTPDGSDLVVVLASRAALRDGLGDAPSKPLHAGAAVLPVLLGDDLIPLCFPVPSKHLPRVTDAGTLLRVLEDHRKTAGSKIADSKSDVFGYGLLLALLARDRA